MWSWGVQRTRCEIRFMRAKEDRQAWPMQSESHITLALGESMLMLRVRAGYS